ncbi:MAG: hypothetical protein IJK26_10160 [Clostridia bacterium]|nr:hypothetical protein [Clostridia bacterium]
MDKVSRFTLTENGYTIYNCFIKSVEVKLRGDNLVFCLEISGQTGCLLTFSQEQVVPVIKALDAGNNVLTALIKKYVRIAVKESRACFIGDIIKEEWVNLDD